MKTGTSPAAQPSPQVSITQVTDISELPPLPESASAPDRWDLIHGLTAEVVEGSAVVSGQRILRLVAVGADGRHALGARFDSLAPGGVYRAVAWVKAEPGVRVMIEARDAVDPHTGNPSNYGVAQFDLAARAIVNSTGDILATGVDAATDGWVKLWVDLRSKDGQAFVLIGLLEGTNNQHVFAAAGQEATFGGLLALATGLNASWRFLQSLLLSSEYYAALDFFRNDHYWKDSLTSHEGVALLYELARVRRPSIVLEIGTYEGRTTQAIARALRQNGTGIIHTVGPFDFKRFQPLFECWPEDLKPHVHYHALSSMDFYMKADQERMRFDLVYVDGNHDYEFALFDIQAAAARMMPGGFIVIDNISQGGPYFAAVDFLRARREWADCGEPRISTTRWPYDRDRVSIPGTDFMILQAPTAYHVGARPVSFGTAVWDSNLISGVKLVPSERATGTVHVQCILRGFGGHHHPIEVVGETALRIVAQNEITLALPLTIDEMGQYSVETWLTWDGTVSLKLSAPPAPF